MERIREKMLQLFKNNRIEIMDRCPVDYPVKKMCKKTIKRDGKLVE